MIRELEGLLPLSPGLFFARQPFRARDRRLKVYPMDVFFVVHVANFVALFAASIRSCPGLEAHLLEAFVHTPRARRIAAADPRLQADPAEPVTLLALHGGAARAVT